MTLYAYHDELNDCIATVNFEPEGIAFIAIPDDTDVNTLYYKDTEIRSKGLSPSRYHRWDNDAEAWLDQSQVMLPEIKRKALEVLAETTSVVRGRFVSPITSQSTVLELKRQQATAFLAELAELPSGLEPEAADYPLIYAEVGITADTPENVAQVYLGLNKVYLEALAQLEKARLTAVNEIESADNSTTISSALNTFTNYVDSVMQ